MKIEFERGTLQQTLSEHGIEDYLRHQVEDFDDDDIGRKIRKACGIGRRKQTVYEATHQVPSMSEENVQKEPINLEPERDPGRVAGLAEAQARAQRNERQGDRYR